MGKAKSTTLPGSLQTRYKQKEMLEMRMAGWKYPDLAQHFGCSVTYCIKLVNKALKEVTKGPAEEFLDLELMKLDEYQKEVLAVLKRFHPVINQGQIVRFKQEGDLPDEPGQALQDDGPILQSIDRLLKISERRAKLLGLDKPDKKEITGKDGEPLLSNQAAADEAAKATREAMLAAVSEGGE